MSDIQQALAVMDERWGGYGNAKAEIRAHIEAQAAEIVRLREDSRRLDWLERHPDAIRRSRGYRGAADSWSMRLRPEDAAQDFDTLRAAIDDAMRGGAE